MEETSTLLPTVEYAHILADLIKALVWPGLILIILHRFSTPLSDAIPRLTKATFPGGFGFDFHKEIREAQEISEQLEPTERPEGAEDIARIPLNEVNKRLVSLGLRPSPSGVDTNYYRNIAEQDVGVALSGLRIELENMGYNLAKGYGVEIKPNSNASSVFHQLRQNGAITTNQNRLTQKIINFCNSAIQGNKFNREQAEEIFNMADRLASQYIDWLSWGFSAHKEV